MIWQHKHTGAIAISGERHTAATYRAALDGAKALAVKTGQAVYAFKFMESTLAGAGWCYSFVAPHYGTRGKVHTVNAGA
jgi:hypothetical protein